MKTAQSKAIVFVPNILGRFIIGLVFVAGLALGAAGSATAQSGSICSKFDSGKDGWGPCSWAPNVSVTTSTSGGIGKDDSYLQITDLSGASAVCSSDPKYLGNWVEKMGGCGQFCFDFKVFSSGIPPSAVTPSFSIYSGTSRATFYANFQVAIGDTNWHQKICAPIMLGDSAPPSPNGHWVISGGSWNSIITNVTMVSLPIDFSSSPSEVVGYDNICMSPGGCGEKPKEEITGCLKDSKFAVKCNPDGTYTFTLSGAGTSGSVITLVSQTPGVTVMPPQQPWAATTTWTINGATPGQLVALNANASKTGGGTAPGSDECCSGDIKVVMPECENKPPIDLKVEKENTPSGGQGNGFNVWVTNVGAPITFAPGQLTVDDVIPAGLNIFTQSSPNWTCSPLPATGPATIHCTYNLAGSLGTGAQLTDSLVFTGVLTNHEKPLENCATVSIPASVGIDTNSSNDKACVTIKDIKVGDLVVQKEAEYIGPILLPLQPYPIYFSCTDGTSGTLNVTPGTPQTVNNLPYGTSCTLSEGMFTTPPGLCPATWTPVWTTNYVPSSTVPINSPSTTVIVKNKLTCKAPGDGSLTVTKTVVNKTQGTLSTAGLSYPISVSCASGGSPAVITNFNLAQNGSQTVSNIALNSSCTITEPSTPAPTGVCGTAGAMPAWSTVMIPASPVAINGTNVSVTVQNTLECKLDGGGSLGTLKVTKTIVNNTGQPDPTTSFPVTVSCVPASGPAVVTNASLTGGGSTTVSNIALGSTCTVNEPTPPDAGLCVAGAAWTVSYTGQNPVLVGSSPVVVGVTNTLNCKQTGGGGTGSLVVRKSLTNNTDASLVGVTYPATVSCVSGMSPAVTSSFTLAHNSPHTATNLVVGSVCTVTETQPPPPTSGCPAGQEPVWVTPPVYTPATAIVGTNPIMVVQNTLNCAPKKAGITVLKCSAPLIANGSRTACVCPAGRVQRGKSCVEQVVCREPAQLNSRGTACVCPRGMTKKGNSCVEREREQPRVRPDDVLRVLPGLIGPGGFGGGGSRGGGGGEPKGGGYTPPGRP